MFEPDDTAADESLLDDEDLLAYSRLMAIHYPSNLPPRPPPRPHSSDDSGGLRDEEEEQKPVYRIIPFLKKTEVSLNFPRKSLEEFMDRWAELAFVGNLFPIFQFNAETTLRAINYGLMYSEPSLTK